jgi:DNA-directed RNA polymerase specialized sigma24 family protein
LLTRRIRSVESEAWGGLIARFEGRLLAFVQSRTPNRAAAEDVVQETCIGFLTSLPAPAPDQSPPREQLRSYVLDALPEALGDYIRFHLEVVGCRYCRANLADLRQQQAELPEVVRSRRRKFFQSSAGYLRQR